MLIEVSGVDGAGKSSLIDRLRRHMSESRSGRAYERVVRSDGRNLLEWAADVSGQPFESTQTELVVILDVLRQAHADLHLYRQNRTSHAFVTFYHAALLARLHLKGLHGEANLLPLVGLLPRPDFSFRITVPAELALARLRRRAKGDSLLCEPGPELAAEASSRSWTEAARTLPYRQVVLDGSLAADQVAHQAVQSLLDLLPGCAAPA